MKLVISYFFKTLRVSKNIWNKNCRA